MIEQHINNKSQIQSIQFFRGLAAIAVVFHHVIRGTLIIELKENV